MALTLTSLTPDRGTTTGGTVVTLGGTGFATGLQVTFDGVAASVTVDSSSQARATSPAHALGAVQVQASYPASHAVQGLSPSAGDGQVALSWSAPDNATAAQVSGYRVLLTSPGARSVDVGTTSATITGLLDGVLYSFSVIPIGAQGLGVAASTSATPVDTTSPAVSSFTIGTPSGLTVPVTAFVATDNVGVTGYAITTSATPPALGAFASLPSTWTAAGDGSYTLYPWARDAAGNISAVFGSPRSVSVDATAPVVTAFTLGTPSGLTVPISALTATDAIGVTGYAITTSNVAPSLGTFGSAPSSWTAGADGTYTLYSWARDAAGNISSSVSAGPVTVTGPDTTAPDSPSITLPSYALSTAVTGISLSAHDAIGVVGYYIKDVAHGASAPSAPLAGDAGWTAVTSAVNYSTSSASYTVAATGSRDCYAWFKDSAANVSAASSVSTVNVAFIVKYWTGYTLAADTVFCSTTASTSKGGFAFKVASNTTVSRAQVKCRTAPSGHTDSNSVRARICGDSSGLPNESSVLGTKTGITGMPSTTSTDWTVTAAFDSAVSVTAGTQYHMVFDLQSPSGTSYVYEYEYGTGDPSSDGFATDGYTGSAWHTYDTYCPAFALWV